VLSVGRRARVELCDLCEPTVPSLWQASIGGLPARINKRLPGRINGLFGSIQLSVIYFPSILDIEPFLFQPIKQKNGVGLHGLFRLVDSRRGAVISPPTHPLRLCYVISDPALRPELAPKLEARRKVRSWGGSR
jgi:hypothetical protein